MKKTIVFIIVWLLVVVGVLFFWNKSKINLTKPDVKVETQKPIAVKLYYYNQEKDKDAKGNVLCSSEGLQSLDREFQSSDDIIKDTIQLLLIGNIRNDERDSGIKTEYPLSGFNLTDYDLTGGVLTLRFADPQNKTSGGSCRVSILRAEIEATGMQFDGVKEVKILPEELLQP